MKHRLKFFGCLLGVGLVLIGLVYASLTMTPAGYKAYQARGEEARARIDGALQSYSANRGKTDSAKPLPPLAKPVPQASAGSPRGGGAPEEAVDFGKALAELDQQAQALRSITGWDSPFLQYPIGACSILTTEAEFEAGPGPLRPGPALREYLLSQAALRLVGFRIWELRGDRPPAPVQPSLARFHPGPGMRTAQSAPDRGVARPTPTPFVPAAPTKEQEKERKKALRAALDRGMDCAERFLLGKNWQGVNGWVQNISTDGRPTLNDWGLLTFAQPAILRAAAHHEEEKTAALLDGLLLAMNIVHPSGFPIESWSHSRVQSLLFTLDRQGLMPGEKFSQARQILERGILTAEQLEDLERLYAESVRQEMHRRLSDWIYHTRDNGWHNLLGGFPEFMTNQPLARVAQGRIDRLVMAWLKGDEAEIQRQIAQVKTTTALMNFKENKFAERYTIFEPLVNLRFSRRDMGFKFNDNINVTLLILAATRFHQERGRYPERVEELVPGLLDPAFAQSQESTWALLTFPQTSLPVPRGKEDDPIVKAVDKYRKEKQRYPVSVEELRPYLANPAQAEAFGTQVEPFAARPVFCQFRRLPAEWTPVEAQRADGEFPRRGEFDSKKLLHGSGSAPKPRLVWVDLRVPYWPAGPGRLLELLKIVPEPGKPVAAPGATQKRKEHHPA